MNEFVTINHGSGGRQAQELIKKVFADRFMMEEPLTDSAFISAHNSGTAFTTDSYVIDPIFFPGGNIGKLAVCGTVNDLAVSGADPAFISASFIIEEGFPVDELEIIAASMADEALNAGVRIITGDTKVVGKGKCDRLFITTSGIGYLKEGRIFLGRGELVKPSDKLIINGPLGNHSVAVLGARTHAPFSTSVVSDCSCLNHMIKRVLDNTKSVRFMRDITRGGLAAVANELCHITGLGVSVIEEAVPVDEPVRGICEVFGFDPLNMANEGKILMVVGPEESQEVLRIMHSDPAGKEAAMIGEVLEENQKVVVMNTRAGGRRIIDLPSGAQLPRIC